MISASPWPSQAGAKIASNLPGGTGSDEKFYFSPGTEFPVFDLCGTKIGIQICYDRKYPEGSRLLALKGAEILFMPICAATYGETKLRGNTWELPLQARAYDLDNVAAAQTSLPWWRDRRPPLAVGLA